MTQVLSRYDGWLSQGGPSALVLKEYLQPAAGAGAVLFPPTYAGEGYVIDGEGGNNVCLFDSVGSQANRLEAVFKLDKYKSLVPQVTIRVGDRVVNLLDVGHRAADALVRSSSLAKEIEMAFVSYENGDAAPLAHLAPTTLVFGAWDSRGTQAKVPRLVDGSIRAHNVMRLHRGAQYFSALTNDEVNELVGDTLKQKDALSEAGFLDAPSVTPNGGVVVKGSIVRSAILNLTALRALGGSQEMRRYVLGLALVSALAPDDLFLRQGCLLVRDAIQPIEQTLVFRNGETSVYADSEMEVDEYASAAAAEVGVGENRDVPFDPKIAKAILDSNAQKKPKRAK